MTVTPEEAFAEDARQRVRDQIALIRTVTPIEADTDDDADFNYLYHPDHVLIRDADLPRVRDVFTNRQDVFDGQGDTVGNPIPGLTRYLLPISRVSQSRSVPEALTVLDDELDPGTVTPEHFVHLCGAGTCCPATEPAETGLRMPWPACHTDPAAGSGVRVSVVDTGLHHPSTMNPATPWLADVTGVDEQAGQATQELAAYEGHGTFVAGVVRCRAPGAIVDVERFTVSAAGAILEGDLVEQLRQSLVEPPDLINLSAGCFTRDDHPLKAFETLWDDHLQQLPSTVLIAAAGNDSTEKPFWPAAFGWAVGVGSLDRDGAVSGFSNHGPSADVFALGRNHVNAFPDGTYLCRETPDKGDLRMFSTGLARWSGTSFAAPLVTGLIAARMHSEGSDAPTARDAVLQSATIYDHPRLGKVRVLPNP